MQNRAVPIPTVGLPPAPDDALVGKGGVQQVSDFGAIWPFLGIELEALGIFTQNYAYLFAQPLALLATASPLPAPLTCP
jgi:hypothetical protein